MILVKKRDNTEEEFSFDKLHKAVEGAFRDSGELDHLTASRLEDFDNYIMQSINTTNDSNLVIDVDDIHNLVEQYLMINNFFSIARGYIVKRYNNALLKSSNKDLTDGLAEKLFALNVENQNANLDEYSFGGRLGESTRFVVKDFALNYCMSKKSKENHLNNEIYIHDLDSYAVGMHNCFNGRTKIITSEGVRTLNSFVDGQIITVLNKNGDWVKGTVHQYGKQKMYNLEFTAGLTKKTVVCTRDHRWILENGEVTTNIQIGDTLCLTPHINNDAAIDDKLWCFGFILGDGFDYMMRSKDNKTITNSGMAVRLCNEKVQHLNKFLRVGYSVKQHHPNGDVTVHTRGNGSYKQRFLESSIWNLLDKNSNSSIFEGYLAADGGADSSTVTTTNEKMAEFIAFAAPLAGYYIWSSREVVKSTNYKEDVKYYEFHLTRKQSKRHPWVLTNISASRNGDNGMQTAWCVEVEDTHSFILDGCMVTGNCLSFPFDDMLAKGFNTRQTDVRPANSINTAFQLVAVLFQLQSLQQFGGVSATHLDWTMVPYVRKSFFKHYLLSVLKDSPDFLDLDLLSMIYDTYSDEVGVERNRVEEWIEQHKEECLKKLNLKEEDFYLGNPNLEKRHYQSALYDVISEAKQAVEGMYHNLNTLQSRSGNQLPFTSINYGTCTSEEGRLITNALLQGSLKGVGKFHRTSIFPCGIFQYMKGVNDKPGTPNYDLFRLALKSTSKRLYPNYANVDWSGNAGYDLNDPRTYFSTMGCHAKGTKIVMADGTRKNVEDIVIGDRLAGVNNEVKTVEKLIQGVGKMYKVEQSRGETYVVNDGHILALEYSCSREYRGYKKGDKVNMTINELLSIPESSRKFFKGYKSSYELEEKEYEIPPYILGLWLGDGTRTSTKFSVNINETQIIEDLAKYAESIGEKITVKEDGENCLSVNIVRSNNKNEGNQFKQALINYNLIGNKHIPECYFLGSKEQRSALLAGLINTDGWARTGRGRQTVCFGNTNLDLIYGVQKLANSLGYVTSVIKARGETIGSGICEGSVLKPYYHVSIHRYDNELLMEHKRTNINLKSTRDFSTSTLKITELPEDTFYGFELDGDRLYLLDDCTVTHNCRTANGWDVNGFGQLKDGRGNICPVTVILPTLAMEAGRDVEKFMRLLGKKIGEAKDMLIERFNWICNQSPDSAKFMYENGTMAGYIPEEGIRSALKHGTLAMGQLGLAETLRLLIGVDQTTEEGMKLAKRIESLFKKRCAEYKEKYKLNFGVYFSPAENLCYTAMSKFKAKYGIIPEVSDRLFFTNSTHISVWKEIDPFEKINLEAQLSGYSSAGCITYVELPASGQHNLDALETLVTYAMDKDLPYFAINVPNDTCNNCGTTGEFNDHCPECGSTDILQLKRVTGYLTGNYRTAFNLGKQEEVQYRTKHIKG